MPVAAFSAFALCSAAGSFAADSTSRPPITIYEASGNLESKHDLGCVGIKKLSNKHTPADLYKAVSRCIEQGKHKAGAFLFALAGVYGRFDTLRVADRTAHQAVAVLGMQALAPLGKDKKNAFKGVLNKTLGDPENLAAACKDIARIGPPDYYPRYMIQHGMGAFLKNASGDGLVGDFDAKAAWKKSLDAYLHCPGL